MELGLEGNLAKDHVHMVLSVPPKYSIAMVIGFLKGKSVIRINRMLDHNKGNLFGRNFWSRGYNVSTVGLHLEVIRNYVKNQLENDRNEDELK